MTLSDYRRAESDGIGVKYYSQVATASEYYPFGMLLTDGNYSCGSYRFGFQGQEMDNEIKDVGNSINFKYRMHDPRIGRFFAVDPLAASYPQWSPYVFSGNQVIHMVELEGLEPASTQDKQNAQKKINTFSNNTSTTSVYTNVSKQDVVTGTSARINNPELVDQDQLNLCGPAAYCMAWASYDPEGYAQAAIDLYQTGSYTYNGKTITANPDTYGQNVPAGMSAVDWMMLSAIRYSENAWYDYDPSKDRGTAAFTTHWEMSAWLENIVGVSENRDSSPTINEINTATNANKLVILLVDWKQLQGTKKKGKGGSKKSNKPDSYISSVVGNHYVIMHSPINVNGNTASFTVWTWGATRNISINKENFDSAVKDSFTID